MRELYSSCKSKIKSIYIFIFCHLDICTGLGSVKKGVPCELSELLSQGVEQQSVRLAGGRVWALQGAEPRSWQGNSPGCSAAEPSLTQHLLGNALEPVSSQELLAQPAHQAVPAGFPVLAVAGM